MAACAIAKRMMTRASHSETMGDLFHLFRFQLGNIWVKRSAGGAGTPAVWMISGMPGLPLQERMPRERHQPHWRRTRDPGWPAGPGPVRSRSHRHPAPTMGYGPPLGRLRRGWRTDGQAA